MNSTLLLHNKTEAVATIRGFHFQYLKTLKSWLECYENYEEDIYCEVEDDLMNENSITKYVKFTQIKSYSSEFRLNSNAVKKTIVNFFNIFNRYSLDKNEFSFIFYSNSNPVDDTLLKKWVLCQENIPDDILVNVCDEVYKILQEKFAPEILSVAGFEPKSTNFIEFIRKIKWVFENQTPEDSIKELIIQIKGLIKIIPDSPTIEGHEDLIFSKLYFETVQTSSNKDNKSRKLTHQKLIDIIASEDNNWYIEAKEGWSKHNPIYFSFGEFYSIREGAIHSHYTKYLKNDIPFWINKLDYFISNSKDNIISKRQAMYEVIVISLRSLKTLDNRGDYILNYFSNFINYIDEIHLEEATILLNYLHTAKGFEKFEIPVDIEKIKTWIKELGEVLLKEIENAINPSRLAYLLEIKGNFEFFFHSDNDPNKIKQLQSGINASNHWYKKIISNLPNAPLFPIKKFIYNANRKLESILKINEQLQEISEVQGIDITETENIVSQFEDIYNEIRHKDVHSKKQRALNYVDKNEHLKALKILHRIKDELFNYENLEQSLLTRLLISELYLKLGHTFAAKYYGLSVCDTIMENGGSNGSLRNLLPKAIFYTAKADYNQGQWVNYLFYVRAFLLTKEITIKNFSSKLDKYESDLYNQLVIILFLNKKFSFIPHGKLKNLIPIDKFLTTEIEVGVNQLISTTKKTSNKELWRQLEEQIVDSPFCDYSKIRTITWKSYEINWVIDYENSYHHVTCSEQFLAFFQIVLTELNELDLCFPKVEVNLKITKNKINNEFIINNKSSNEKRIWEIKIPTNENLTEDNNKLYFENLESSLLKISMTILMELSPLNDEILLEKLKEALIENSHLSHKVSISKPYEIINKYFVSERYFNDFYSSPKRKLPYNFTSSLKTLLTERSGLGLPYDKIYNLQQIDSRYKRIIPLIRFTLKKLIIERKFQGIVKTLKSEGYLDWHILACIANIKANYFNINLWERGFSHKECIDKTVKMMETPENCFEDSITPISEFTLPAFKKAIHMYTISTLQSYNLVYRSDFPLLKPLETLLIERFNFKIDDVEHPDYWKGEELNL